MESFFFFKPIKSEKGRGFGGREAPFLVCVPSPREERDMLVKSKTTLIFFQQLLRGRFGKQQGVSAGQSVVFPSYDWQAPPPQPPAEASETWRQKTQGNVPSCSIFGSENWVVEVAVQPSRNPQPHLSAGCVCVGDSKPFKKKNKT